MTYKNFDLGINLRSWIDFDVYNTINMYYGIQGQGNLNVLKDAYGKFNHIKGEKQICDYFLEDGTFLKIDAITLGYTLPMKKYTNNLIDRIRIYGTVGNVCTITGYSGMNRRWISRAGIKERKSSGAISIRSPYLDIRYAV